MKKILLSLSLAALTAGSMFAAEAPVLYGVKTYSETETPSGIYTVRAEKDAQPEIYWADGDLKGNAGAVYAEGKYYVLNYLNFFGMMYWSHLVCDLEQKNFSSSMSSTFSPKDVGSALTYDPTTGNIYSVCIDEINSGRYTLSIMNTESGAKTPVAPLAQRMLTMAATIDGTIYGIGPDGALYMVDKTTGSAKYVGSTGVQPNDVNQSAVIDYATGIMYWAAMTEDGGALYTVDTATGTAELLSVFANKEQLVGLSIIQSAVSPTAPEPVANFKVNFIKDAYKGSCSFALPKNDVSGNELCGKLKYTLTSGKTILAQREGAPGASILLSIELENGGNTPFTVVVQNEAGENSLPTSTYRWIGIDTPAAVSDLTLNADGNELTLTWNLPETGINGGYVAQEKVRHIITRHPDDVVISDNFEGTSFTETIETAAMMNISYTVQPYVGTTTGRATESNTVVIGSGLAVPFSEDLTKPGCIDFYTVVDANDDNFRWYYSSYDECVIADYTTSRPTNDDWLFSPAIHLEVGLNYKLSLDLCSAGVRNWDTYEQDDAYAGNIGVSIGKSTTVEAMTKTVIADTEVVSAKRYILTSDDFSVDEDGDFYLGISHTGKSGYPGLNLYGIAMETTGSSDVADVSDSAGIAVSTSGKTIEISNPAGIPVTVYTVAGNTVFTGNGSAQLSVAPGVYLVSTPSHTHKILVR